METHEQKTPVRDAFLRTIAVLGLIAVLLLGAWGIIQLAIALPSIFSNIGGGVSSIFTKTPKETLVVSTPSTLSSGESLTVNWTHQNKSGEYSYTLSYACQNGLSVKAPLPNGSYQVIACNTPFNFVNAGSHMTILPHVDSTSEPLTITVAATKLSTGAITASGLGTTTIAPQGSTAANNTPSTSTTNPKPTKTTPNYTYYPAHSRTTMYGYPDLVVHMIGATPNGSPASPSQGGRMNVQFEIINTGTNAVYNGWTLNAVLPIQGSYTFMSQPQQTLYPGDKIVYNLGYDNYNTNYNNYTYTYPASGYYASGYTCNMYGPCNIPGYTTYGAGYNYGNSYNYNQGSVTITADPYNYIVESNKGNNTATIPVPVY